MDETVKRLSALQAATGFFPDESDDENEAAKATIQRGVVPEKCVNGWIGPDRPSNLLRSP